MRRRRGRLAGYNKRSQVFRSVSPKPMTEAEKRREAVIAEIKSRSTMGWLVDVVSDDE